MQKEIPILFNADMVNAILSNRKRMTRRIVKGGFDPNSYGVVKLLSNEREGVGLQAFFFNEGDSECWGIKSKWRKGDVLWVRESFSKGYEDILDDPENKYVTFKNGDQIFLKSGYFKRSAVPTKQSLSGIKWKPSIHMYKWASRIWLEITSVRVERLHSISERDAILEGVELAPSVPGDDKPVYKNYRTDGAIWNSAANSFGSLWEKINGTENFVSNPWVWVVEFKVLSTTGRPVIEGNNHGMNPEMCDATDAK